MDATIRWSLEGPRPLGALAGKVVEQDDAWATDPDIEATFYEPGS